MKHFILMTAVVISGVLAKAQEMSLNGVEKIVIVSPFAHVSMIPGSVAILRIAGSSQLSWSTRMDGKILRITGSAASGTKMTPNVKVDILGPSIPVEVHLADGIVSASKWTQPLTIDLLKGKLTAKDCKTSISGLVQNGSATITDHQGPTELEFFRGEAAFKNYLGDVKVSGFKVDLNAEKFTGLLNLNQHHGGSKITKSGGTLRFENSKATLAAIDFNGRIEGSTAEGYVNIQAGKEPEVQVKTQSGKISVSAPGSGALVSAHNEEGEIQGPSSMKVEKDKGARVLRGRLKGSDKGGRIELTSLSGTLVIRE